MYFKKSVEKFLVDQKIKENKVEAIKGRLDEFGEPTFSAGYLDYVMGKELAQTYTIACENDPSLLMFGH